MGTNWHVLYTQKWMLFHFKIEQVAQLWQRDCAKIETFSINVSVTRKIMHKIAFLGHPMTDRRNYYPQDRASIGASRSKKSHP